MKSWLVAVACAVAGSHANVASADERLVTTSVSLSWERQSNGLSVRAKVPEATVRVSIFEDGLRMFAIEFDAGGPYCMTIVEPKADANLNCGRTRDRVYALHQFVGAPVRLDLETWVGR